MDKEWPPDLLRKELLGPYAKYAKAGKQYGERRHKSMEKRVILPHPAEQTIKQILDPVNAGKRKWREEALLSLQCQVKALVKEKEQTERVNQKYERLLALLGYLLNGFISYSNPKVKRLMEGLLCQGKGEAVTNVRKALGWVYKETGVIDAG